MQKSHDDDDDFDGKDRLVKLVINSKSVEMSIIRRYRLQL